MLQLLECVFAVAGVMKVKPKWLEAAPNQVRMVGVVFGKEHPRGAAGGARAVGHVFRLRLGEGIRKYAKLRISLEARKRKINLCRVRR
jgi:hypothetical protein